MFRLVILECPYYTFSDNKLAQDIFGRVMGMRINGYKRFYKDGVFPFGCEDFLADHLVVLDDEMMPVTALKILEFNRCKIFEITPPLYSWLSNPKNDPEIFQKVRKYVEERLSAGKNVAYLGSYARGKSVSKENGILIRNILTVGLVNHFNHLKIDDSFAAAIFKAGDKIAEWWGHSPFVEETMYLIDINCAPGKVEHMVRFSNEALSVARKLESYWQHRMHFKIPEKANGSTVSEFPTGTA